MALWLGNSDPQAQELLLVMARFISAERRPIEDSQEFLDRMEFEGANRRDFASFLPPDIAKEFLEVTERGLAVQISDLFSGDRVVRAIARRLCPTTLHNLFTLADNCEKAMKGRGTDEDLLLGNLLQPGEWFVVDGLEAAYRERYGVELDARVKAELSGLDLEIAGGAFDGAEYFICSSNAHWLVKGFYARRQQQRSDRLKAVRAAPNPYALSANAERENILEVMRSYKRVEIDAVRAEAARTSTEALLERIAR